MSKQSTANDIYFAHREKKRKDILPLIIKYTECSEAYAGTLYAKAKKHTTERLRTAKSATVSEGRVVYVGDVVEFKSDIEQSGTITDIKRERGYTSLVLENEHGFCGEYLRYATITEEDASRCW